MMPTHTAGRIAMASLEGEVAFITGAGSGIGRGTAVRLARDGADICIADIDEDGAAETASMVREFGRDALTVKTNVAVMSQVQDAVAACVSELGRIDIAVANAGVGRGGLLLEMGQKEWQDQLDINLSGVFYTAQAAAKKMVELENGGRIVCISSLAAENTSATMWAYSATKAGVRKKNSKAQKKTGKRRKNSSVMANG